MYYCELLDNYCDTSVCAQYERVENGQLVIVNVYDFREYYYCTDANGHSWIESSSSCMCG